MRIAPVLLAMAIAFNTTACVRSRAGDTYSREEAQRTMTFREGVLIDVRKVKLEGTQSPVGMGAGAAVGGIAGSGVGSGRGAAVGAVVGAVVGGIIGAASEEAYTRSEAWELTIQPDQGAPVVVVQEIGSDVFAKGEHVRILQSGGRTRISH